MTRALLITPYGFQNTGVRLLAAVLRREGFEAPVLFFKGWRNNDVRPPTETEYRLLSDHVREQRPDVVGIGFGTPYLGIVTEMTRRLRGVTDAHVIWGGVHPTICPEDCIPHADSVCVGEGELPLLDLVRAVRDRLPVETIPNLWVRRGGEVWRNLPRPLIQDLDSLPYATLAEGDMAVVEGNRIRPGNPSEDNALYRIFASRGCPFGCAFCYNSQYRQIYRGLGRYHRSRSVASVLAELEAARARLPRLRRVRFDDDSFVFPPAWVEELARDYPRRVGLPFDILLNPQAASEQSLRLLRGAGLVHAQVGIQSGSEAEVEAHYSRRASNQDTLDLACLLRQLGVEVTYDVILDNPLASTADKQAMVELLLELPRPFNLFLYSLTPFPKSEITDKLLAAGLITGEEVEGRATKSFSQFRLSLDYPRAPEETFFACLISLTSKGFVPRRLIRSLSQSRRLRLHPAPLRLAAELANAAKLGGVAFRMLRRGELSTFKVAEYASFRRRLIQ
ncbi:MAG: hypothetical protein C3F15_04520 [Holophagae bacterium]|nr:MAG: hypothetical protein C3F15_04520 [Holophagae bacterium]